METTHTPHARLIERAKHGPHLRRDEHVGINGRIAMLITNAVGTMWCAYVFAGIALISLPSAIQGGTAALIAWIAQTFLQLVLLSVIMVGQKVSAAAFDKQALQTYQDAEAIMHECQQLQAHLQSQDQLLGSIVARMQALETAREQS